MTDPNHPNHPSDPIDPNHPDHLSEPMSPPHPYYEELPFLNPREEAVRFTVRYGDDRRPPGRPGVLARRATLGAGWPVLQFRLTASAQADPQAYALLEREVSAAVAIERRYGAEKFGAVFARVVGFDLTAPEPFVLYRLPGGRPLTEWTGRLGPEEQERIIGQLSLAVRLLEEAGLVHRAVGPDTVRWDGAHVRLCEPFAALRAGRSASRSAARPGHRPNSVPGSALPTRATTCGPSPSSATTSSPAAPPGAKGLPGTSATTAASPPWGRAASSPRGPRNGRGLPSSCGS